MPCSLTTGTIVNRLLDAKPVNAVFGNENFDDVAQATWGFSTTDVYRDANGAVNSIQGLGYKKYCYVAYGYCLSHRFDWNPPVAPWYGKTDCYAQTNSWNIEGSVYKNVNICNNWHAGGYYQCDNQVGNSSFVNISTTCGAYGSTTHYKP